MLESHGFQAARGVADSLHAPFATTTDRRMIPSAGHAGVAKLAYAQDLKSCGPKGPYGFDPRLLHHDPEQTCLRRLPIDRRCVFRLVGLCNSPALCMALEQYLGSD